MSRYQFIVGVSLAALEQELNQKMNDQPCLRLSQIFYAQGTGFVAVTEKIGDNEEKENLLSTLDESKRNKRKLPKKL
ncbi:MAG: hypothetical protein JSR71_03235 [Proteobacteria bacterium]|nr:hypothetical protein [Pseudomonadota bacterium]